MEPAECLQQVEVGCGRRDVQVCLCGRQDLVKRGPLFKRGNRSRRGNFRKDCHCGTASITAQSCDHDDEASPIPHCGAVLVARCNDVQWLAEPKGRPLAGKIRQFHHRIFGATAVCLHLPAVWIHRARKRAIASSAQRDNSLEPVSKVEAAFF